MANCVSTKEMVAVILQYLNENNFYEAARMLEQESGIFFNEIYFEEKILVGEWEPLEKYLLGFTKVHDNMHSVNIFFEIRKLKYLEALDSNKRACAVDILRKELKEFSTYNENVFKELCALTTLNNFRENEYLLHYGDTQKCRSELVIHLKKLIEDNPALRGKRTFPSSSSARLLSIIKERLSHLGTASTSEAGSHVVMETSTDAAVNVEASTASEQIPMPVMETSTDAAVNMEASNASEQIPTPIMKQEEGAE